MRGRLWGTALTVIVAATASQPAWAADPAPATNPAAGDGQGAESASAPTEIAQVDDAEIIVTARRREERVQDTPVAVTALSGNTLEQASISTVTQLAAQTPSLVTLLPALLEAPMMLKTFAKYQPQHLLRSASHHLEIVSAMESRDPEWAASVMRSHILAAHAALRDDPDSPTPSVR